MTTDSTQDWAGLARQIREARVAQGRTQLEAAYAAGISDQVWSHLERATRESYRDRTLNAVERTLEWMPGSIEDVLAGHDPTLVEDVIEQERHEVAAIRARLAAAPDRATRAAWDDDLADAEAELARAELVLEHYRVHDRPAESDADHLNDDPGWEDGPKADPDTALEDHEERLRTLEQAVADLNRLVVGISANMPAFAYAADSSVAGDPGPLDDIELTNRPENDPEPEGP